MLFQQIGLLARLSLLVSSFKGPKQLLSCGFWTFSWTKRQWRAYYFTGAARHLSFLLLNLVNMNLMALMKELYKELYVSCKPCKINIFRVWIIRYYVNTFVEFLVQLFFHAKSSYHILWNVVLNTKWNVIKKKWELAWNCDTRAKAWVTQLDCLLPKKAYVCKC